MTVRDLREKLSKFRQSLENHRETWSNSLDVDYPDYPTHSRDILEEQMKELHKQFYILEPYIDMFTKHRVMIHRLSGSQWDIYFSAIGNDHATTKGVSLNNAILELAGIIGMLEEKPDDEEINLEVASTERAGVVTNDVEAVAQELKSHLEGFARFISPDYTYSLYRVLMKLQSVKQPDEPIFDSDRYVALLNNWYYTIREIFYAFESSLDATSLALFAQVFSSAVRGFESYLKDLERLVNSSGPVTTEVLEIYSDLKERYNVAIDSYERFLWELERQTGEKCALEFRRIKDLSTARTAGPQTSSAAEMVFAEGSEYDAYKAILAVMQSATEDLLIVDNYIDLDLLDALASLSKSISIRILSKKLEPGFTPAAKKLRSQRGQLEIKTTKNIHDRFVVIDGSRCYHLGPSIKDAGQKLGVFSEMQNATEINRVISEIEAKWSSGLVVV